MKHLQKLILAAGLLLLLPGLALAEEAAPTRYERMASHYEAIRLALVGDSLDGVETNAEALLSTAAALRESLSADMTGIAADDFESGVEALEAIESAASKLARSADIESARDAFFVLTRPMAKYRKLTGDPSTLVAYCSMAQKAWVQPRGELGNPYMGQKMPRCGEVVGE